MAEVTITVPDGMRVLIVPENAAVLVAEATAEGVVVKAEAIARMGEEAAFAAAVGA